MNCTFHIQNPIIAICIAPHKCLCQRKLCVECLYNHGVDILRETIYVNKFQEFAFKKLQDTKFDQTFEVTSWRMDFKSMLSLKEVQLRKIWDELSESIQQINNMIEMQDKQYLSIINKNQNPAELPNTELEKFVENLKETNQIIGVMKGIPIQSSCRRRGIGGNKKFKYLSITIFLKSSDSSSQPVSLIQSLFMMSCKIALLLYVIILQIILHFHLKDQNNNLLQILIYHFYFVFFLINLELRCFFINYFLFLTDI